MIFGVEIDFLDSERSRFDEEGEEVIADLLEAVLGADPPTREWRPAFGTLRGSGELAGLREPLAPPGPGKELLVSMYLKGGDPDGPVPNGGPQLEVFEPDPPAGWREVVSLSDFPFLLVREEEEGEIWFVASAYPFTNLAVAEGNAAHLLSALASAASDRGRRALYFDEYCHGLWERRGLFGWIWGTSLVYPAAGACLLFALFLWRGVVRLGAPSRPRTSPRRAKEEFVVSLADIYLRAGRYRAAGKWIIEAYRRQLAARLGTDLKSDEFSATSDELGKLHDEARSAARYGESELTRSVRRAEAIYRRHLDTPDGRPASRPS